MNSQLKHISSLENIFDLTENPSLIDFGGRKIRSEWLPTYQSDQTSFLCQYILLNENILLIRSSGKPNKEDIRKSTKQLEQSHIDKNILNAEVLWDIRELENPGIRVRNAIFQSNRRLSTYWKKRHLIIPQRFKTLIRIYKFIFSSGDKSLYISRSVEESLNKIILNKSPKEDNDGPVSLFEQDRAELLGKSKDELVDIIENFKKAHDTSTDKVLEAIGSIYDNGKFNQTEIEIEENDSHFDLLNAFSFFQSDVEEIVKEFKGLNQRLELNVAERIVDFIDKESNLRSILDNSDRVTWLMNSRYELIDFNIAFSDELKTSYNITPQINQNVLDIFPNEKERQVWKHRFDTVLSGKPGIYLDQDNRDGQERVMQIKTFPISEFGNIKGASIYIEDITELKKSQFRLIDKNRDLQKVNSELDSFVYRVSHDLRAPLTSILGLISLMKIETNHDKVAEYIDLQEKSILKLDLFIKEIINLSRNSRLGITVSKIDFDVLLNEIFESQNYNKAAEHVNRICVIEENIAFYTDRQRLSIILNNLISNSLKYVSPHKEEPFVEVNVYSEGDNCVIEVSDNGIGISDIYIPKIFKMFFRATQDFNGSGLGLYIVKETIEKLKGKITVKSKMRYGTTFKVIIPNLKERYDAAPKLDE